MLRALLERRGVEPRGDWLLAPGENYEDRLRRLNLASTAFVFVISPDSVASAACLRELATAVESRKQILPLSRRDHQDDNLLDAALRSPQWTFFRDGDDFEAAATDLVRAARTDFALMAMHSGLLTAADVWNDSGRRRGYLLPKERLREAEQWLARASAAPARLPQPTELEVEYIVASQRDRLRTFRIIAAVAVIAGLLMVGLAVVAEIQRRAAVARRREAEAQTRTATARQMLTQIERMKLLGLRNIRERALLAMQALRLSSDPDANVELLETLTAVNHYIARTSLGGEASAVSRNGLHAASYDPATGIVRVFSTAGHALVPQWSAHFPTDAGYALAIAVSSDGKQVAMTFDSPCTVIVQEARMQGAQLVPVEVLRVSHDEMGRYGSLDFNDSGEYLRATQFEELIRTREAPGLLPLPPSPEPPANLAVSPSGRYLATVTRGAGKEQGHLDVYALPGMQPLKRFPLAAETVRVIAFTPSEETIVVSADSALYSVYSNWLSGSYRIETIANIRGDEELPLPATIRFSADGELMFLCSGGRGVEQHPGTQDWVDMPDPPDPEHHRTTVYTLRGWTYSREVVGRIVLAGEDTDYYVNSGDVTSIGVREDAILTTDMGGRLTFWEPELRFGTPRKVARSRDDHERLLRLERAKAATAAKTVEISLDGQRLLARDGEGRIRIWSLTGAQRPPRTFPAAGSWKGSIAFALDSRFLITTAEDKQIWRIVADGPPERLVTLRKDAAVSTVAVSADDRYVAVADGGTVNIYRDWKTGQPRLDHSFVMMGGVASPGQQPVPLDVNTLAFHPNGDFLAVGDSQEIRVFDVARGVFWVRIPHRLGRLDSLHFTPDGAFIVLESDEGRRSWRWRPADLMADACAAFLFRSELTGAEWDVLAPSAPREPVCRPGI